MSPRAAPVRLDAAGAERTARWTAALATRPTDRPGRPGPYEALGRPAAGSALPVARRRGIPSGDLGGVLFGRGLTGRADGLCRAGAGERDGSVRTYDTVEESGRPPIVLTPQARMATDNRFHL
ncbi:hypothetical protein ACH5AO_13825 [Streptomyces sp. NPDC018964]|uniref:hypothetical protein n=1 Tax=Streptomyces sp. NPDC018964 TaxID=3365058 RepID=UPI0037AE65D6